jgi:Fuc2NAc and GlcNAc transferase
MSVLALLALGAAAVAAWLLTAAVRRFALAHAVLDVPNQRSAHRVPTPRGGGLAIAAVSLGGTIAAGIGGLVPGRVALALVGGGALVAVVGWLDDRRGLSVAARATAHAAAAAWAVACLRGLPVLDVGAGSLSLGPLGALAALIGIVWGINLYNFMDGIDGLAGGEAVLVGAAGGGLLLLDGAAGLAFVSFLLAAASAGFLVWNWSPARLFMGDVGSGLLGYLFAVLALASERSGAVPALVWVLLLGVFVFDATVTLLRRAVRGERWYAAHASHAYQRAVRAGRTHARVTTAVLGLGLVLAALATLAVGRPAALPLSLLTGAAVLTTAYVGVERHLPM